MADTTKAVVLNPTGDQSISQTVKENAPLNQSILNFANIDAPSTKRKRHTLIVKGEELDLESTTLPVRKTVVEAMRIRIIELEDAIESQPPLKRAKTSKTEQAPLSGPSASSKTASMNAKVDKKKVDVLLKKFWSSLQKEVKTEKYKFRGRDPKVCRIEEVIEETEFHAIFNGKGLQTQPTPINKPTSTVTIKEFMADEVENLFGKHYKELKGNRYSVGGILAKFAKGEKIGLVVLQINSLQISYAKNTMKCALKFEVEEATPYRLGRDEDFDEDGYYMGPRRNCGWFLGSKDTASWPY